ncbi:MAG: right-handed parallel beta-helix repeat-containing protein [Ktedonobacteraceae bacterium]
MSRAAGPGLQRQSVGPSTSVVVSNNTVYNIGGDGIVVTDGLKQMISYNVVYNTHKDTTPSAGIWTEDSYEATIEDNEVYNVQFNGGTIDAEAFDTDRCDIGATFEYNYSHANDGGFLLMAGYSQDPTVRYNISQNDGNSTDPTNLRYFLMNNSATTAEGVQIYNNDIFSNLNTGENPVGLIYTSNLSYNTQPFFENNLILNENPAGNCFINIGANNEPNPWLVSNNDVYGYNPPCSYSHAISGNPEFTSPPAGVGHNSASSAYTLVQGAPVPSPAFCQGAIIANNGGLDFDGVALPAGVVDAGALEKGAGIC